MTSLFVLTLLFAPAPVEGLLAAHGFGRPAADARLDAAAADLARRVDLAQGDVAAGQLQFVLDQAGVVDAWVMPFSVVHPPGADLAPRLPPLAGRLDRRFPPTHYGVGEAARGADVVTVILLVHRGVELDSPLPLQTKLNDIRQLRGTLRAGYFHPRLLVAPPPPHGVRELPARADGRGVEAVVAFSAGPGVYGVELLADSQHGPVVLTNQRVWVGQAPPAWPQVHLSPGPTTQAPAPVLVAWINLLRRDHGLRALDVDPGLATVADEHARDLARRDALVHHSPDSGTLTTRLKARGIRVLAAAENLARADDVRGAMRAFLDSPGHRRVLLMPEATHLGVAAVGRYYTVVLARLPGVTPR